MNPDKQRIAIAEVCGWNHVHYARDLSGSVGRDIFRGHPPGVREHYENVPDYLSDLNAMHEAEKVLNMNQSYAYGDRLARMVREPENIRFGEKASKRFPLNGWGHFHVAHLTAAQRAEAFLRTLNKWTDSDGGVPFDP